MRTEIAVSEQTVQFAYALRDAAWELLKEQLSPEHLDLVMDYEALYLYPGIASGRIDAGESGRRDAPYSLMDTIAHVLTLLPRKHWPDRAIDYTEQCPMAFEALQVIAARAGGGDHAHHE